MKNSKKMHAKQPKGHGNLGGMAQGSRSEGAMKLEGAATHMHSHPKHNHSEVYGAAPGSKSLCSERGLVGKK